MNPNRNHRPRTGQRLLPWGLLVISLFFAYRALTADTPVTVALAGAAGLVWLFWTVKAFRRRQGGAA